MSNTRFASATHILTLLASQPNEWVSSEYMAGSMNVNPVVVRKELSVLSEVGLVISKRGKEGGVQLAKPSDKISMADVYLAVKNAEVLGKKNHSPNPKCPIGRQINTKLNTMFTETDRLVVESLKGKTLAAFLKQFA